jgi:energy-converting hydrogenase Eha subunit B
MRAGPSSAGHDYPAGGSRTAWRVCGYPSAAGPSPAGSLLGIVGSFVGGFVINLVFRGNATISTAGWIGSIVGAIIVRLIYRATIRGRRGPTRI